MHFDSKTISWVILAGGLLLYLLNIIENEFVYAAIFMASSILLWMFIGFTSDSFDNKQFSQVLSGAGFLLAISVFFLYGLEEIPYPSGAIVFHSDGIAKALGLGIAASLPLLFGIDNNKITHTNSKVSAPSTSTKPTTVVDDEDFELADVDVMVNVADSVFVSVISTDPGVNVRSVPEGVNVRTPPRTASLILNGTLDDAVPE